MKGKICDWKDDKGFGFIVPEDQKDKIFFHISDIKTKQRRPKVGDFVEFNLTQDNRQRVKAKHITIKGLSSEKNILKNQSNVEPVRKTTFDYIAIIVLLLSITIAGFIFYQTKDLNKIISYGIAAIISLIFYQDKRSQKQNILLVRVVKSLLNLISEQYKLGIKVFLNSTALLAISNG